MDQRRLHSETLAGDPIAAPGLAQDYPPRESPQTVEEEPEGQESPGWVPQALRRACRGFGEARFSTLNFR